MSNHRNTNFSLNQTKQAFTENIEAAIAVADAVRTCLGPRGMDKMVVQSGGALVVTNDGATVLTKTRVEHPVAKMMVELANSQDIIAGDGTTTVTILCGSLLKKCLGLLDAGIHPTKISDIYYKAAQEASIFLEKNMGIPIDLTDRDSLTKVAYTSLNSKVVCNYSSLLSPIAVDCVIKTINPQAPCTINLKDIKIMKILGGNVGDSELIDGLILKQKTPSKGSVMQRPYTSVQKPMICLAQFHISPPKSDIESSIFINNYTQMDQGLKDERNYSLNIVKKIKATGCNVLLIQKSILRDALSEVGESYLTKAKIFFVKDIERDEIEFISKALNCVPVAHIDQLTPETLSQAGSVEEMQLGSQKVVKITGITNAGNKAPSTIVLRGSTKLILDEADRSLHDALCVVRCLVQKPYIVSGGASCEIEVARQLSAQAKVMEGVESHCTRAFSQALEIIPFTLAENAGLNPLEILSFLWSQHVRGNIFDGINVYDGSVVNMLAENVVQPLLVTVSALKLAGECARTILKIDHIIEIVQK